MASRRRSRVLLESIAQHDREKSSPQSLPPAWDSAFDSSSGKTYYFNTITREVSWTRPLPGPQTTVIPQQQPSSSSSLTQSTELTGRFVEAWESHGTAMEGTSECSPASELKSQMAPQEPAQPEASAPAETTVQAEMLAVGEMPVLAQAQVPDGAQEQAEVPDQVGLHQPAHEQAHENTGEEPDMAVLRATFELFCKYGHGHTRSRAHSVETNASHADDAYRPRSSSAVASDDAVGAQIDSAHFRKLMLEAGLAHSGVKCGAPNNITDVGRGGTGGPMTVAEADLCFNYCLLRGRRRLDFESFVRAVLPQVARRVFPALDVATAQRRVQLAVQRATPQHHASVVHAQRTMSAEQRAAGQIAAAERVALKRVADREIVQGAHVGASSTQTSIQRGTAIAREGTRLLTHAVIDENTMARMRTTFVHYCAFGKTHTSGDVMDGFTFVKLHRDCGLMHARRLSKARLDLIFTQALDRGNHFLTFEQFMERALPLVAHHRFGREGVWQGASALANSKHAQAADALLRLVHQILQSAGPQTYLTPSQHKVRPATAEFDRAVRRHFRSSRFDN